jgi:hypothetical protein
MGWGAQAKKLALKRLVDLNQCDILLIQETMGKGDPLVVELRKFWVIGIFLWLILMDYLGVNYRVESQHFNNELFFLLLWFVYKGI